MTTNTILLLLLSLLLAGGLSYYHYLYKAKIRSKVLLILAFLRFFTVFGILLLLINPIFSRRTFEIVKTPLAVAVDNSRSITSLKANKETLEIYKKITTNTALQEKFDIQSYAFDSGFETAENFDFKGKQTNIDVVAKSLRSINKNISFPTVLITDGNQTTGDDYVYSFDANNKVFPIVVGDITTFFDLRIGQLNVNKYAFHKNKFPVEVFLNYSGTKNCTAKVMISLGNTVLNSQLVSFSPNKKSEIVSLNLPADKVGLSIFKVTISSNEKEKNTYNNTKNFAVEIIDQKSEIAIVSSINHPDIGALKRAIETNVQRKVTIVKPKDSNDLDKYAVVILYQPTAEFQSVFENSRKIGINTFIITGTTTDFNFLNQQQTSLSFKMSSQKEEYLAKFNSDFNLFALDDIGFEEFPPLQNTFGTINYTEDVNILLSSKIRNIETSSPLLAFSENQGRRMAFLLGENSWKWRLKSHVDTKSYFKYDVFIDKTIQYLATNTSKKSLIVNHESFYNAGDAIEISAQYFNKNYEFDEKARLNITVVNKNTKAIKTYDLLKTNTSFKANLDGLAAGQYNFVVKELNSNTIYNGYFEILDFDIENQFVNPDLNLLSQLASQTNGEVIYPDKVDSLIKMLLENEKYKAIQKAIVTKTPLIDFVLLLILIAISLASEWFIRKYNGML
ncbi:MAG: hypothetical protein RL308_1524 [Bacteroidota bacterium]|jgi:hypothetical protein